MKIGEATGIIEVRPVEGQRHLRIRSGGVVEITGLIAERVRRLFDLKADPAEISGHLASGPSLTAAVEAYPGLRVPGTWDAFEIGVRAILGQQVSVMAATTLSGRLVEAYGTALSGGGQNGLQWLLPDPERLSRVTLSKVGLPLKRADAIRQFARAVHRGDVALTSSSGLETTSRA